MNLFYNIRYRYELRVVDIVRVCPRFGVLLFCMTLSVVFIVIDLLSVTPVIPIGVINPFWKFSMVFKCLSDTIILDDFKTALDKLSRHRRSQILPFDAFANTQWLADGRGPDYDEKKICPTRSHSGHASVQQIETVGDGRRPTVSFPPPTFSSGLCSKTPL